MRFQCPISAATALGPSSRSKINDACGDTALPSFWDKCQQIEQPLSDCQEMQCLRRPLEVVEGVRFFSTLAQSRRYFPQIRQSPWPTHSIFVKFRKETVHLTTPSTARFEASAAASLGSSLFWNVTQPRFMIGYRHFGTACQSSLPRSNSKRRAWAFQMAPKTVQKHL